MLWAMRSLTFFGFLWVNEFTIPSEDSYDPTNHLSLQDILINSRDSPHLLQFSIKQSKTGGVDSILRSNRQHSLSDQGSGQCFHI